MPHYDVSEKKALDLNKNLFQGFDEAKSELKKLSEQKHTSVLP